MVNNSSHHAALTHHRLVGSNCLHQTFCCLALEQLFGAHPPCVRQTDRLSINSNCLHQTIAPHRLVGSNDVIAFNNRRCLFGVGATVYTLFTLSINNNSNCLHQLQLFVCSHTTLLMLDAMTNKQRLLARRYNVRTPNNCSNTKQTKAIVVVVVGSTKKLSPTL